MSAVDDLKTFGRARLSFANEAEIDEFVATLERYERGELSADGWRAYRLVRGTYGQRQAEDAQMLRVKIPQGVLTILRTSSASRTPASASGRRAPPGLSPAPRHSSTSHHRFWLGEIHNGRVPTVSESGA